MQAEAWKGGEVALKLKRLRAAFDKKDTDKSGYLDRKEISAALSQSGVIASEVRLASYYFLRFLFILPRVLMFVSYSERILWRV